MDPFVAGALINVGAQIFGGILAGNARDEANEAMNRRLAEIMKKFNALQIPSIEKQRLILEEVKSAGIYVPEIEDIIRLGPSAWEKIAIPPELKADQYATLEALDEMIEGGGLSKRDEANLLEVADRTASKAAGRRERTAQQFRERGLGGSGLEYQSLLAGDQAGDQAEAVRAREIEARSEERALELMLEKDRQSRDLYNLERTEQTDLANSRDSVDRFNTEALLGRERSRVANENAARQGNLANKQQLMNQNVGIRNKQQQYNKELIRQNYLDKYNKLRSSLGFESQANQNQYKQDLAGADSTYNAWAGAGQIGSSIFQNQANQDWEKKLAIYKKTGKW